MLTGDWGSGKTWLIKKSISDLEATGGKALYLSLYGLSSIAAIESELFRLTHPVLSDKRVQFAGRLASGLLKSALKIDLPSEQGESIALSISLPDISIAEFFQQSNDHAIIFDDIERCNVPLRELMGYINFFVEHLGLKAILVANEGELVQDLTAETEHPTDAPPTSGAYYSRTKEKIVGFSYRVESDPESAINIFLSELAPGKALTLLHERERQIIEIYAASGYNNLRNLRQALQWFIELTRGLSNEFLSDQLLMGDLLSSYLIYSLEIRSGKLTPAELSHSPFEKWNALTGVESTPLREKFEELTTKYTGFVWLEGPIPESAWGNVFRTGLFDFEQLNSAISNSKYCLESRLSEWQKLWHYYELDGKVLQQLLEAVERKFANQQYTSLGEFRHVAGLLMRLGTVDLSSKSAPQWLEIAKSCFDELAIRGAFCAEVLAAGGSGDELDSIGWGGLGFAGTNLPEFSQLNKPISDGLLHLWEQRLPAYAASILQELRSNIREAARHFSDGGDLCFIPIFHRMSEDAFLDFCRDGTYEKTNVLGAIFRTRYRTQYAIDKLKIESAWLHSTALKLGELADAQKGLVEGLRLRNLANILASCLSRGQGSL